MPPALRFHWIVTLAATTLATAAAGEPVRYQATDTLAPARDASPDAQACLESLCWEPRAFEVTVERLPRPGDRKRLRFPSPINTDRPRNDRVVMDWYVAQGDRASNARGPAVVVVHESGSEMPVARMFAYCLQLKGVHAFLIYLPGYGERRADIRSAQHLVASIRQATADVRRARDAIAALPELEGARVSLQGVSLGGFVVATAASLDNAFDRIFIMLAGGNLYDLLMQGHRETKEAREMLAAAGYSGSSLRDLVGQVEPTRIAHRLPASRTWLFSATLDKVVPPANARALARAAGLAPDHHVRFLANHYSGIIYLPTLVDRVVREVATPPPASRNNAPDRE